MNGDYEMPKLPSDHIFDSDIFSPAKVRVTKDDRIFAGKDSGEMWEEIITSKTVKDLRSALYTVCCRLQRLEEVVNKKRG